ncbi:MAG: DUF4352 domain-containing protein [Clostridium sp.]|nr:DUF4352 domain-containing protein [Clostridium sp.]
MKKLWCLLAILVLSVTLTGCGVELSDEENRVIAEYAADLLLKYDRDYTSSLVEEEVPATEQTTQAPSTDSTTEVTTEEPSTQPPQESSSTESPASEDTTGSSDAAGEIDIGKIVGLEGISITYNQCMFLDRYPSVDQDGAFIYLEADPGYQLVVIKFDIANITAQDIAVDLLNTDINYKLVYNQTKAASPMLTILMDDLGTYESVVPAGNEQSAVLVFQISKDLISQIQSLDIRVTYKNEESVIHIQ